MGKTEVTQSLVSSSRPEIKLTVKLQTGLSGWHRELPALFPSVVKPGECVVETENLRAGLSRVYVLFCVYTSLCMSIFVTLCVSLCVGVASLEVLDSLRAEIMERPAQSRPKHWPASSSLSPTVSHVELHLSTVCLSSLETTAASAFFYFPVCWHPNAVFMLENRFLGQCAVIVTSDLLLVTMSNKKSLVTVLIHTLVLDHVYGNYFSVQWVMFGFCVLFCFKTCLKAWVLSYSTHNQTRGRYWGGDREKAQWSRWGGSQRWGRFWIGGAHDWQPKQLTRCWARNRSAEWHGNKTAKW